MKKIYSLVAILFISIGYAQIPAGYYNNATGIGAVLKTQLFNIIKGQTDLGYNGLWTTYQTSDIDHQYENDGTIMDIYSENPTGPDPYTYTYGTSQCGTYTGEGNCYNREHMIPQSVFASVNPIHNDAHFITATDGKVNGERSNYPHGNVAVASWTSQNGSKLGSSAIPGYTGTVFEPINEFKGDVARMYFYFVTRYEDTVANYSYAAFSGNAYPAIDSAFLTMLIQWSTNDPVSAREIERNNAIYARQGNRNPYIDHPEYVGLVWGGGSCPADAIAPTMVTGLTVGTITSSTIALSWNASTDNTGVTNYDIYVDGVKYASSGGGTSITLNGLNPTTTYAIYVLAKDCQGNLSPASATVNPTTTAGPAGGSTCVAEDFETIPANASSYTINTWTKSGITWTATDSRTDQTVNTRAITVRNGSLSASTSANGIGDLTVTTMLKFAGSAGTFNLRVNGNIVATIPYSAALTTSTITDIDIPNNVTISITDNSTATNRVAFDDISWTCFSGLGVNNNTLDDKSFKIYPNPSNGTFNIEFNDLSGNYSVEIYSTIGQKVYELKDSNKQNIEVSNLQQGIYLVKLTKDSKTIVKKIIIN